MGIGKSKAQQGDVPYMIAKGNSNAVKALVFVCVLLTLSNIVFAGFAAQQYARKEKTPEPIIYEVDKTAQKIVQVERGNLAASKQSLLRSLTLRNYVLDRETVNHIDEKERFRKVRLMSGKRVWNEFQTLMNPEINENSVLKNKKFKREIEIITDYPLPSQNNVHQVEYYLTDTIDGERLPTQRFVAIIQYDMSTAQVRHQDRFINIDGVTIVNYKIYGA